MPALGQKAPTTDQFRFEPTVFGAVRRYHLMVVAIAVVSTVVAVGYTLVVPERFRADASLTVPPPLAVKDLGSNEYLDGQVLLLQSVDVAQRAATIANRTLGTQTLSADDFAGDTKSLQVTPPDKASSGTYGAATITVAFSWSDAQTAQVGANSLLQAFDDARTAAIVADGNATIAGIERAMADARSQNQRVDLIGERTRALVNLQIDMMHHPVTSPAELPEVPTNGNSKQGALIGLLAGLALGAAAAFARAVRRVGFGNRTDPSALYGVPLIAEIPPSDTRKSLLPRPGKADVLPVQTAGGSASAEAFRIVVESLERLRRGPLPRRSLVFISPAAGAGTSAVVANVALAMAEGGTRVLAVDADPAGRLSGLLLPGGTGGDGFAQVVAGAVAAADVVRRSPAHPGISVLPAGAPTAERTTGVAYTKAVGALLAEATDDYDVVLVDSAGLLQTAAAAALVVACDAAVIVVDSRDLVRDHRAMADRLDLIECAVLGYVYDSAHPRFEPVPAPPVDETAAYDDAPGTQPFPAVTEAPPAATAEVPPQRNGVPSERWRPSPYPRPRPDPAPSTTANGTDLPLRSPR
jgi:Mrp family chromosome partitioning ATPase